MGTGLACCTKVTSNLEKVEFPRPCNRKKAIHPKAVEVHGITMEKLTEAPPLHTVLPSFMEFVGEFFCDLTQQTGNSPLIAHNASFDLRMLTQDLEVLKIEHLLAGKQV